MKFIPPTLLFLFSFLFTQAQNNQRIIDSLEKLIPAQKDSALVATYNELTWQYRLVNRNKAIEYGNKAIELGKKINYLKGVAQAYNDLGIIYFDKENYDTAIALYQQSLNMRKQLNDELGMAKLYNKIGIVYQKEGKFDKALEYQFLALELFEKYKNDVGISYSLNNIGIINQNMGRYKEAIEYQEKSIVIKEKIGDKYGLAGSYVNVANIYLLEENYSKAKEFYLNGVDMLRQINDKEYLANALNNLGRLYIRTKEFNKAMPAVKEAFTLRESLQDTKGMVSCLNNMANIFIEKKQYDSAAITLNQAIVLGKNAVNCKPELNTSYQLFSTVYESTGNTTKALEMYKLYASTKDSLYTDQVGERFAELETKYKTLEKEKTIQQQQFEITRRNYWIAGIIALLILGGLLAYSYYHRYQLKQKSILQAAIMKQQELSTKAVIEAEETERQRIAKDLHDGVGQMMSAAKMNLSAFESEIKFSNKEQEISFEKIISLVDDSCKEVRNVSHNMMPNALLKNSLAAAVREFIDKLDKKTLQVHVFTEGLDERLDTNVETVLYRVIQECVNNVIKHAGADTLDISVIKDADGLTATIEDNGAGFNTADAKKFDGMGLKNIRTRVEYLKGTVDFSSTLGKGTLVAIYIPLSVAS